MTHTPQPLTDMQLKQLMTDLNKNRIATRKQGGTQLSYLETWDVKATLIRIFGFGGFSAEADLCDIVRIENNVPKTDWVEVQGSSKKQKREIPIEFTPDGQIKFGTANFRVTARVRVKLTIHQLGAVYTEWAASSQTGPDLGEVTDFAIKTAESDALKRAAIYLGTQFGLSLYNDGATQDVVKAILSPGQEWLRGARQFPDAARVVEAAIDGRPASAGASVAHLKPEDVDEAAHQQRMQQLDSALSAQASKPREQRTAEYQHRAGDDVPAVLDPSYDGAKVDDELRAKAAADAQ